MVSTHVFFVRARKEGGRDKKSVILFSWITGGWGGIISTGKKGLISTNSNLLSLHMLRLENTNWVLVSSPFMSREQLQDSAGSSTVCAVNSCQYHLRSLNDLKTQKLRWRNNNFQSLGSPLFHLFCLNNPPL